MSYTLCAASLLLVGSANAGGVKGGMDGQRFDELTRLLGTGRSRRQTLKFVLAGLGAAAVGFRRTGDVSAGVCRPETSPCFESSDCCSPAICTYGACYPAGGCLSEGE